MIDSPSASRAAAVPRTSFRRPADPQRRSEIEIERDEATILTLAVLDQIAIQAPFEVLLGDGGGVVSCSGEDLLAAVAKILIELELHAVAGSKGTWT